MHRPAWTYPHAGPPFLDVHTEPLPFKCRGGGAFLHGSLGEALSTWAPTASEHHTNAGLVPFSRLSSRERWPSRTENWPPGLSAAQRQSEVQNETKPHSAQQGENNLCLCSEHRYFLRALKWQERQRKERRKERKEEGREREGGEVQLCPHAKSLPSQIKPHFSIYVFLQQIIFKYLLCAKR